MIDLRSDICSEPTEEMWDTMRAHTPAWPMFDTDVALERLERDGAALLGKQAAVLVPTCTAANVAALLTLAEPGRAVVLEQDAHILTSEGMGIRSLARLRPVTLAGTRGHLEPSRVAEAITVNDAAVLCLENTNTRAGGTAISARETAELAAVAHEHGAVVHLDGARLANASVALGVPLATLAAPADTVAFSLNKGLSAPFGALLAGSTDTVAAAREQIKALGAGTLHKLGIFAAAGTIALGMIDRLADDHRRASRLAELLREGGLEVDPVESNIVFCHCPSGAEAVAERLAERGVASFIRDDFRLRFVTHRLIGDAEIDEAAAAIIASASVVTA